MKKYRRVFQKIDNAYAEFKKNMLSLSSEEVYDYAYKISCIEEIYEILLNGYEFSSEEVRNILRFKGNILLRIYEEWTDYKNNWHDDYMYVLDNAIASIEKCSMKLKCA